MRCHYNVFIPQFLVFCSFISISIHYSPPIVTVVAYSYHSQQNILFRMRRVFLLYCCYKITSSFKASYIFNRIRVKNLIMVSQRKSFAAGILIVVNQMIKNGNHICSRFHKRSCRISWLSFFRLMTCL